MGIDADAREGELRHVRAADDDESGRLQARHDGRVSGRRRGVGKGAGARARGLAGQVEEILDRDRDSRKRRRRGAGCAQRVHGVGDARRGLVDREERASALPRPVGDPVETLVHQLP
jgi:hypothetical protein